MVSRAVTQLYDNVLRPSGLRVTQVSILATIARLGEAKLVSGSRQGIRKSPCVKPPGLATVAVWLFP
jgi:hypothetical protein